MNATGEYVAERARAMPVSLTVAMADMASAMRAEGRHVVDFSAGRAAEATDPEICTAGMAAMREGDTHQTPAKGTPAYLEAVVDKLRRENGLHYDPRTEVMATLGCKNALVLALHALLDPGDEVIVEDPCFVSYAPTITLAGGVPVPVALEDGRGWSTARLLDATTDRTKAILFCSPHNPLGIVHNEEDLDGIAEAAAQKDLIVLADEIYEALTWGGRVHLPIAALPGMRNRTVGMMGMTKSFSMGGWRTGYVYGPAAIIRQMAAIQAHLVTCASSINQRAGTRALSADITNKLRDGVWKDWERKCHDVSLALDSIEGLSCSMPEGGFYAWTDVSATGLDGETFCNRLLAEQAVSTVPGASFGASASCFVRITCVKSQPDIETGLDRIRKFVGSL